MWKVQSTFILALDRKKTFPLPSLPFQKPGATTGSEKHTGTDMNKIMEVIRKKPDPEAEQKPRPRIQNPWGEIYEENI